MRFPIVWITFALCVVLCSFVETQCGPVSRQDVDQEDQAVREARQIPYDDEDEEDSDEDDDDDAEEQQLNFPAAALNLSGEDEDEGRSFLRRRSVREVSQKPVVEVEADEESVIPSAVPEKKPSVLELLSSALDKAIEATSKIPTQQVASDAAGVFQILGQVFSEAIDKVIGDDDGPEDNSTEVAPESVADNKVPEVLVVPLKEEQQQPAEQQEEETSQSDKEIVNNL